MAANDNGNANSAGSTPDDAGVVGEFSSPPDRPLVLAPATSNQLNHVGELLRPLACWRLDDPRFDFNSSILRPQAVKEFKALAKLRQSYQDSPLALFGHADPVGRDDYNKELSGRRVRAVYALLTRNVEMWETLYTTQIQSVGDNWKYKAIQIMLAGLGFDPGSESGALDSSTVDALKAFQQQNGLVADGDPGPLTRKPLFSSYMDAICRDGFDKLLVLQTTDFLARGAAADGKGDYQGCGEFNPVLMFSKQESDDLSDPARRVERDAKNAPNRRVLGLLFRPGAQVSPSKWPCPAATDGGQACTKRFWSDSTKRRQFQEKRKTFAETQDTFACRFYQRLTDQSPCEGAIPVRVCTVRITPKVFANAGNVIAVAERLDGKGFPTVNSMQLGSLSMSGASQVWVSESGLLYFVPPSDQDGAFFDLQLPSTGHAFVLENRVSYTADPLQSVKSLVSQMPILRSALQLHHAEGTERNEQYDDLRDQYEVVLVEGHRRLEAALNRITELGQPITNSDAIVDELNKLSSHGRALDVFARAAFSGDDTAIA